VSHSSHAPGLRERRLGRGIRPARDSEASAFTAILDDLVARVPGAIAAGFVDSEGESVDYAGWLTPFDIKVAGAHWRIILNQLKELRWLGTPRTLVVRGAKRSTIARLLQDGYAIVLVLGRRAGFALPERAFSACEVAIAIEAGWPLDARKFARWFPVLVEVDARRRPASIVYGGLAEQVEVLGRLVEPPVSSSEAPAKIREQAFRVRLASGPEITLVREQGGFWYAEEPV
jgi:hypothetical protein